MFQIQLPQAFYSILQNEDEVLSGWRFLERDEALRLKAELDARYDYPGREWRGIPFASSTTSEDVVCFDLSGESETEALVVPVRNWHGPRWEFAGSMKTFRQWLRHDSGGNIT